MSYSISAKAATKSLLLAALASKMAEVVASQPVHAADQAQALSAAESFVSLMPETPPDGKAFTASMNGSITTTDDQPISVSVGFNAYFTDADPAA